MSDRYGLICRNQIHGDYKTGEELEFHQNCLFKSFNYDNRPHRLEECRIVVYSPLNPQPKETQ